MVADRGCRGDPRICAPDDAHNKEHKYAMSVLRARHETLNGRLKNWGCLRQIFRHDRNKHHMVLQTAVVVAQINISIGNPLFQVNIYEDSAILS